MNLIKLYYFERITHSLLLLLGFLYVVREVSIQVMHVIEHVRQGIFVQLGRRGVSGSQRRDGLRKQYRYLPCPLLVYLQLPTYDVDFALKSSVN